MGAPNRDAIYAQVAPLLSRDVADLAPGLQDPFNNAVEACRMAGITITVIETYRMPKIEVLYYSIGRDTETGEVVDPPVVTNCHNGETCWHCYRAAVDVGCPENARGMVAHIFARFGFAWGGNWKHIKDLPHFQSDRIPVTPTEQDRADFRAGNIGAVWNRYGLGAE